MNITQEMLDAGTEAMLAFRKSGEDWTTKPAHAAEAAIRAAWNHRHSGCDGEALCVRIGNYGAAFDSPGTRRAFTYKHQPGNVDASRLARAFQSTACESAGDSIDRGLLLLRELEAMGFGVFQLGDAARAGERGVS